MISLAFLCFILKMFAKCYFAFVTKVTDVGGIRAAFLDRDGDLTADDREDLALRRVILLLLVLNVGKFRMS